MRRDDYPLKTLHVVVLIKEEYGDFAEAYLAKNKEERLGRMTRRFIYQHGFSFRGPQKAEQLKFANETGAKEKHHRDCLFNAEETAVLYDGTPTRTISERGWKKGVQITHCTTGGAGHRQKGTAPHHLLGQPDGRVEEEVRNIPSKVMTTVQKNAWMDSRVWHDAFIEGLWAIFVSYTAPGPVALYPDNLKCYVNRVPRSSSCLGTEAVPLPKNTTSMLQPLDLGIVGPFKQKLRALKLTYELGALRAGDSIPLHERLLTLQCLSAPEKCRRLVERVAAAWDSVSEERIRKAWQKVEL
ncbi:LOW QUALITY PROTEIN: hypothetical protein PHPALM_16865 [Phytophthora palmivora]|uniref:DDE-1 domain-containing protein n=1 Tax=Phytophthora palmivora TaxID=4796 RepID=A0A2P4XNR4_9STRA|nr:LOW QUALITY PROTEIN: hypothetical protein PHPALM_16865 [Phytophthora palmivora]